MSYFASRPRSYSKPTREELKGLKSQVSQCNADELRSIIQLAATQSSEAARILLRLLHAQLPDESDRLQQPNYLATTATNEHGILTPIESPEDSEMSGTENVPPSRPQHTMQSGNFLVAPQLKPVSPMQERRLKRKSLAERDDDIPDGRATSLYADNASSGLHHSPSTKRRRPFQQDASANAGATTCVNCGKKYNSLQLNGSYGCLYHPGVLDSVQPDNSGTGTAVRLGAWDCCHASHSSPGCLVTQHRDVKVDGYRISAADAPLGVWGHHMGMRSSFAEMVATKSLSAH
ncbi:hypothetical protein H2198_000932 [Neophaeococcomyces mojaviensis]|uniref:Uncharacterized protein n=1 Tax=Neophaeococcomyces mojaviensis TaxID=3383035 RepID=A0ACC3AI86_9EURO|nr:hypothetical protein H2198_000932 [Knufia sp. JES_112]